MISFFRKIRQKLLQQNRVTQYLTYAIGEIALVMIGILLALQVNNWNENRKARTFETEILSLIDQNLTRDSVLIATELQNAILAVQLTDSILNQIERGIYDERLNVWMGKVVTFERFKSQSSAFEVLKSKGIGTISDKDLQLNLISYYDETLFRVYEALNDVEDFFNGDWIPVIKNEFNDFSYRVRMEPRNPILFFENPSSIVLFKLYKDNREQGSVRRMKTALDEISKLRILIKKQNP
ncbi:MAG: hypothetical protein P8O16_11200 [Algoriphagus sp.]|jgi:hypothetical protein|uniref:hypothetical protein n=1 Tax=Algoriphagus sp. TaxID=1872435 RepID=UPI00261F717F|nr:hypothetical protein [Algoriphagus sp.]MDG1277839.1 hypothetical protein [Algoriphagus sp.]